MIFILSALLTGHRHLAVPAKSFNPNLTKIHWDFGIHGKSRGIKMHHVAF